MQAVMSSAMLRDGRGGCSCVDSAMIRSGWPSDRGDVFPAARSCTRPCSVWSAVFYQISVADLGLTP